MNKVKRLYFAAYGSLLNVDKMILICPESYVFGWGNIQDYELEFLRFESIKESLGSKAPVVLWRITEEDEKSLDLFFDPKVYRKEELKVILSDVNDMVAPYSADYYREGIKALVYIMKDVSVKKPTADLIGANGNISNLIGIASQALKKAGQRELAQIMQERIFSEANNYDEAIQIIIEYVEVE